MTIDAQTVITFGAVVTVIVTLFKYYNKAYSLVKHQEEQDKEMKDTRAEIKEIKAELAIVTRGMLACLKGLQEQGCDGPVTASVNEIENYLNEQAHKA